MIFRILSLLALVAIECGCLSLTVRGGFSPIQGPLAQQSPRPTYPATMSGILSGSITVVLPSQEVCKGSWVFVSKAPPTSTVPVDLAAQWDVVYGAGYYVAHVLGNKLYARATLTGNAGTTVYVELSNENNKPGNTKGVAQDSHGNVFKVSVYN